MEALKFKKQADFEVEPKEVAITLASLSNEEQSEFLNVFFTELRNRCEVAKTNVGMQFAWIVELLDDQTVASLKELVEMSDHFKEHEVQVAEDNKAYAEGRF